MKNKLIITASLVLVLTLATSGMLLSDDNGTDADDGFIEISSVQDMVDLMNNDLTSGDDWAADKKYRQTVELNMSGIAVNPIGNDTTSFKGEYDGNGFAIINLEMDAGGVVPTAYAGMFGYTDGAKIKNVILQNAKISSSSTTTSYAGGLIAHMIDGALELCEIHDSEVRSSVTTITNNVKSYSGGMVGYAEGADFNDLKSIHTDVYADCPINGVLPSTMESFSGGIIGYAKNSSVSSCNTQYDDTVKAVAKTAYSGGIVAYSEGMNIMDSVNDSNVVAESSTLLGISSKPTTRAYAGGIIAYSNGNLTITGCDNRGDVKSDAVESNSSYAGGIVSYVQGTADITNCNNTGDISGRGDISSSVTTNMHVAGILAFSSQKATLSNCHNTGDIDADVRSETNGYVVYTAGIVGRTNAGGVDIRNSSNSGTITQNSVYNGVTPRNINTYSAGIVAHTAAAATIMMCYNEGDITQTSNSSNVYSAGIIGRISTTSTISNCYNVGDISADTTDTSKASYASGLIGEYTSSNNRTVTVENCYTAGSLSASGSDTSIAGIIGNITGSAASTTIDIISSYYLLGTADSLVGKSIASAIINALKNSGPISSSDLRTESKLTDWDFDTIWGIDHSLQINKGLPYFGTTYYSIKVDSSSGGSTSPSGYIKVERGNSVSITFTANNGYVIDSVKINGRNDPYAAGSGSYTFNNVTSNQTIRVDFSKVSGAVFYLNVVSDGGGYAYGSGYYSAGSVVSVYATAKEGYTFKGWSDGSTNPYRNIVVNSDMTLVAFFDDSGSGGWGKSIGDGCCLLWILIIILLAAFIFFIIFWKRRKKDEEEEE